MNDKNPCFGQLAVRMLTRPGLLLTCLKKYAIGNFVILAIMIHLEFIKMCVVEKYL